MKNIIKLKNNFLLFLSLIFIVAFSFGMLVFPLQSGATTNASQISAQSQDSHFYADVYDSSNRFIEPKVTTYSGEEAYVYNWQTARQMKLNIKLSNIGLQSGSTYKLSMAVQYLQGYYKTYDKNTGTTKENSFTNSNVIEIENLFNLEKSVYNSVGIKQDKLYTFSIDSGASSVSLIEGTTISAKGWGIYRFTLFLSIDAGEFSEIGQTNYFIIEPNNQVSEAPKVIHEAINTDTSLYNGFRFSLSNYEVYKYVDQSRLEWFVKGVDENGVSRALTEADKKSKPDDFIGCTDVIYTTYNDSKTGNEFVFDSNGLAGTWTVWCEFNPYNYNAAPTKATIISEHIDVVTGNSFSLVTIMLSTLITIAIILAISLIVVSRKKYKDRIF